MASIISGSGLGLLNTSLLVLGGQGGVGSPVHGRSGEQLYVNAATGNLVLRNQDELLSGRGLDIAAVRTYNSRGGWDGDNSDNWRLGVYRKVYQLTGTVNTAGSTVTRIDSDGSEAVYTYNATAGKYITTDGEGAHDTLSYNAGTATWTWADGNGRVTEMYDAANGGRLTQSADADGNLLFYTYNGSGFITQVSSASGESTYLDYTGSQLTQIRTVKTGDVTVTRTRYQYDGAGRLWKVSTDLTPGDNSISDNDKYVTTYGYYDSTSKRVTSIVQSDGTSLSFTYEIDGSGGYRIKTINAGPGRVTTFTYSSGRTDQVDPLGKITSFYYDGQGRLITLSSPAVGGTTIDTEYAYDGDGNVTQVTRKPHGGSAVSQIDYEYDLKGNQTLQRDLAGNTVTRTYGASNQLISETAYLVADPDGSVSTGQPSVPLTTRYVYDAELHLRFQISSEGGVTEYRYDSYGNRAASIQYAGNSYTASGTPVESDLTTWLSGINKSQSMRVDTVYDFRGLVASATTYAAVDSSGNGIADGTQSVTEYVYDQSGTLLKSVDPRGVATTGNPDDYVTTYAYDGLGRVIATTNALGKTTVSTYDDANNKTVTTLSNGAVSQWLVTTATYNAAGELISLVESDGTNPLGTTLYFYDANGRLRRTEDPTGIKTHVLYDDAGRKIATVDGDGTLTEYIYSASGQITKSVRYATLVSSVNLASLIGGSGVPAEISLTGIRPSTTAADQSAWNVYDAAGRLVKTVDALGYVTKNIYDGAGRLVEMVHYGNAITNLATLPDSPTEAQVSPTASSTNDRKTRQFYDAEGKLRGTLDAEGYLTELVYDKAGRLVETIRYTTLTSSSQWAGGTLDQLRPASVAGDIHTYTRYNARGEIARQVDGEGYLTETLYDLAGNVIQTIRFAGKVTGQALALPGTSGSYASTSDSTANSITGDIDLRFEVEMNDWTPPDYQTLASKWVTAGDQRSYTLRVNPSGQLELLWSVSGASATVQQRISTASIAAADGSEKWIRASLDVNNGASGHDVKFYTSNDGITWNQLGSTITTAGITSVFNGSASLDLGGHAGGTAYLLAGKLFNAELRNGIDGTIVAAFNPSLDAGTSSVTSFVSSTNELWTISGSAVIAPLSTAQAMVNSYGYDSLNRIVSEVNHEGTVTQYIYDDVGNIIKTTTAWDTADVRVLNAQYDRQGRLTGELSGVGSTQLTGVAIADAVVWADHGIFHAYDAAGRRISTTDAKGSKTLFYYDNDGRLTHSINAMGEVKESKYNALGQVIEVVRYGARIALADLSGGLVNTTLTGVVSAIANVAVDSRETITYHNTGLVNVTTDALENTVTDSYNAFREVTARSQQLGGALGTIGQSYAYDKRGLLEQTASDQSGVNAVTTTQYDAFGRAVQIADANGGIRHLAYDKLGRMVNVTDPLGYARTTSYDAFDRVLTVRDALGSVTSYSYDAATRKIVVTMPEGVVTSAERNRHGEIFKATDGNGNVTSYSYDKNGNLKSVTTPAGTTSSIYDQADLLVETTDGNGNKTAYIYDAVNRLLVRTEDPGTGHLNIVTTYAYDAKGQRINVTDANGVVTQTEFDLKGQVARTIVDPAGLNLRTSYTYDGRGKKLTVTEGEGSAQPRVTQYVYDKLGRRTQESVDPLGLNIITAYAYDKNGNVVARTNGVGSVTRYVYDANDRLVYTVDALGYVKETQYDAEGRIVATIQHDLPIVVDSTPTVAEVSAAVTFSTVATTTNAADVAPTQPYTYSTSARDDVSTPATQSVSVANTSQTTTPTTVQPYPYTTAAYSDSASAATQNITVSATNSSVSQSAIVKDYAWYRSGNALYTTGGLSLDYYSAATYDYTPTQVKVDVYVTATGAYVGTAYTDVGSWSTNYTYGEYGYGYTEAGGYYSFNHWNPVTNWAGQVNLPGLGAGTYTAVISTRDDASAMPTGSGSYADNTDGTWTAGNSVVVNVGFQSLPTTVSWLSSTALSGTTPSFKYRVSGSGSGYTTATVTTSGSNHQVSLSSLAAGNYEYVVEYKDSYNRVLKSTSATFTSTVAQTTNHTATFNYTQVTSTSVTGSAFTGYITSGEVSAIDRIETTVKDAITNAVVTSGVKTYPEFESSYNGRINLKASGGSLATGKYNVYVTIYKKDGTVDNRAAIYYEVGAQPDVTQHTVSWVATTALAGTTPNFKYRVQGSSGAYTTVTVASASGNHQAVIASIANGNYEYVVEYKDSYGRVLKSASSTFTVTSSGTASGNVTFNYSSITSNTATGSSITGYVTQSGMPALSSIDRIETTVRDYYTNATVSTATTYPEFHPATYDGRLNLKVGSVLADGKYKITALIYKKDGTTESREITQYEVGQQPSTKVEWSDANRPSGASATFNYALVGSTTYTAATITTTSGVNRVRMEELPPGTYNYIVRYYSASGDLLRDGTGQFTVGSTGTTTGNLVFGAGKRQVNSFVYDTLGRLTGSTDAEGYTESYQYDAVGNKTAFTNKKGATWNYAYDGANRLVSELSPFVDTNTVTESSGTYSTTTTNVRIETRIEYDAIGNVSYRREAYGRPEARTTEYQYDAVGQQIKIIYPQVGVHNASDVLSTNGISGTVTRNETTVSPTVNVAFDGAGRAVVNRDVAGNYSYKVYDAAGRLVFEIDAEHYVTGYSYDGAGNKTVVTRYATALNFNAFTGHSAHTAGAAFTESEVAARLTTSTSADRSIVTTYDVLGRVVQVSEPSVYTYDPTAPAGQQYFTAGRTTKYAYNANGQVVKQSVLRHLGANAGSSGDDVWVNTYFYYDARGNKTAQVDALGYLTKWEYDETGDAVRQIEYAKALTGTWNESGYPTPVSTPSSANDAAGYDREIRYEYDRKNQKVRETRVNVGYTTDTGTASGAPVLTAVNGNVATNFGYDGVGNLTRTTQASGATTYTYYDALGRMIATAEPQRATASDGGAVVMPAISSSTYFFDVGGVVSTNLLSTEAGHQWPGTNQVTLNWSSLEAYGTGAVRVRIEYTQKSVYSGGIGPGPAKVKEQVFGSMAANAGATLAWTDADWEYGGIYAINRVQVFKSVAGQDVLIHDSTADYTAQRVLFAKNHPADTTVVFQYREKGATTWITASLQSNGYAYWFDTNGLTASQYEYQMSYQTGGSVYATGTGTFNVMGGGSTGSLNAVPMVESNPVPVSSIQSSISYGTGDESGGWGWIGSNSVKVNWTQLEGWAGDSVKVRVDYVTSAVWGGAGIASAVEQTFSATNGYGGAVVNWIDVEDGDFYAGIYSVTRVQVSTLVNGVWVVARDSAAAAAERVVLSGNTSGMTGVNITGVGARSVTALGGGRYSVDISGLARGLYQYTVTGNSSAGGAFEIKDGSAAAPGIQEIGNASSRQIRVYGIPATSSNSVVLSYRRAGDTGPYLTRTFNLGGGAWIANYEDIPNGNYEYVINVTGANPGSYSGTFKVLRGAQSLPTVTVTGSVVQSLTPLTQRFLDAYGNVVKTVAYAKGAANGASDTTFSVAGLDAANDQASYAFYDSHSHAVRTVDAELKSRYASYDVMGRVAKEWQSTTGHDSTAQNIVRAFEYDKNGRQIATRSPLSTSLIVNDQAAYNAFGEVTAKGIDDGWQEFYEYDQAGHLWRTNSKDGVDKVALYDLEGRSTAEIRSQSIDLSAAGSVATVAGLTNVMRTTTQYDALGRVVGQAQPSFETTYTQSSIHTGSVSWGISSRATEAYAGEYGYLWDGTNTFSVNWNSLEQWGTGAITVVVDYVTGTEVRSDESGTYYTPGVAQQRSATLAADSTGTTFSWVESLTDSGGIDSITRVRIYKQDAIQGQVLVHDRTATGAYTRMLSVPAPSVSGATTTLQYRVTGTSTWQTLSLTALASSQLVADLRSLGAATYDYQVSYNLSGNPTPYATVSGNFTISGGSSSISFTGYNSATVTPTLQQTVDRWGNVLTHTDALGKLTSYGYNYLNNLTLEEKPLVDVWGVNGTAALQKPTTRNHYDSLGRVIGVTDPNNNSKTARYNEAGQLLAEYQPDGGITRYTYDAFGRQIRVWDANSNLTTRTYDRNNRLTSEQRPIGTDTYAYDEAGNRITQTDANGLVTKYWYDVRGLVTKTRIPMGQESTKTYDKRGFKVGETDANANSMTWSYDYFGRLNSHTNLGGVVATYTYNQANLLTGMTSTSGQNQSTGYYANGLVRNITDHAVGNVTIYEYDANGNRIHEFFSQGGVTKQDSHIRYDALGRVIQVNDNYYSLVYGYDANGNRRYASSNSLNSSGASQRTDSWYLYDSMNRITLSQGVMIGGVIQKASASATVQNLVTGYDGSGNRTISLSGTFVTAAAQGISLGYDGASNRRTATFYESGALVTEDYNYDGNNRLLSTSRGGNYTSLRTYDTGGRVTESVSYSSPGAIGERRVNVYNNNGWLTTQTVKDSSNTTKSVINYTGYDNAGNVTSYNVQVLTGTAYTNYYSYTYLRFGGYKEQVVSGTSSYFSPGSTTTTYDVNGNATGVSETFATSRNRSFVTNQMGQILSKTESGATQRYFFLNNNPVGSAGALAASDFDYNYTPVSDRYPAATPGNYVVSQGDTLRSIALSLFGDAKLWYVIADANGLQSDGDLVVGRNLNIPNKITNLHNDYQTFKPYAPSEVIGDTTPTLPDPPPPPASSGGGCGGLGGILVAVVVIVVAYISQQYYLLSELAATEAAVVASGDFFVEAAFLASEGGAAVSMEAALVGAAAGNIAGQVVGNAIGIQKGFNFASFATDVLSAGLTQGLTSSGTLPGAASFGDRLIRGAATSVINQGLQVVTGQQRAFSWKGVAASALGAAFSPMIGKELGDSPLGKAGTSIIGGAITQVVRDGKVSFSRLATDAFNNFLATELIGQVMNPGQQTQVQSDWVAGQSRRLGLKAPAAGLAPGLDSWRDVGPQLTGDGVRYAADKVEYENSDENPDKQIVQNGKGEEITEVDRENERRIGKESAQVFARDQAYVREVRLTAAAQKAANLRYLIDPTDSMRTGPTVERAIARGLYTPDVVADGSGWLHLAADMAKDAYKLGVAAFAAREGFVVSESAGKALIYGSRAANRALDLPENFRTSSIDNERLLAAKGFNPNVISAIVEDLKPWKLGGALVLGGAAIEGGGAYYQFTKSEGTFADRAILAGELGNTGVKTIATTGVTAGVITAGVYIAGAVGVGTTAIATAPVLLTVGASVVIGSSVTVLYDKVASDAVKSFFRDSYSPFVKK